MKNTIALGLALGTVSFAVAPSAHARTVLVQTEQDLIAAETTGLLPGELQCRRGAPAQAVARPVEARAPGVSW